MKKGLTKTLMAVAVAIMAVQAMAMAPVILDIPSPVVGNAENVTPANGFVYPDAIDLTKFVTDLESQPEQIIWSYTTASAPKYRINNVDALDLGTNDGVHPGTSALNNPVGGGEADPDSNPLTITIRNSDLSPLGGAGTVPGTSGIQDNETQAVTLIASDETTRSMRSFWFYTDNGGADRLSPGTTEIYHYPGTYTSTTGWRYSVITSHGNSYSNGANGAQFCITTVVGTATDGSADQAASWASPYGDHTVTPLQLVANSAYRIRATLSGTQTNADNSPFFDLTVNNSFMEYPAGSGSYIGGTAFGGNFYFLCNQGGAEAPLQADGDKVFTFWWCPPAVSAANWNDTSETGLPLVGGVGHPGPFAPSQIESRVFYIEFRILQSASNLGTNGNRSSGTICLKDLVVERADLSAMVNLTASSPIYNTSNLTAGTIRATAVPTGNATIAFSGGALTITPAGAGAGTAGNFIADVSPGDGNIDYFNQNTTADDYPCPMDNQTLYQISMDLSAPTQGDLDHPIGVLFLGADTLTNELICLAWNTPVNAWHHSAPSLTPQSYKAFFYSNYGTLHANQSQFAWWSEFRPRIQLGSNSALGPAETKTGAIKISNIRVDRVQF